MLRLVKRLLVVPVVVGVVVGLTLPASASATGISVQAVKGTTDQVTGPRTDIVGTGHTTHFKPKTLRVPDIASGRVCSSTNYSFRVLDESRTPQVVLVEDSIFFSMNKGQLELVCIEGGAGLETQYELDNADTGNRELGVLTVTTKG